jgi:signal transduction histidine kinase
VPKAAEQQKFSDNHGFSHSAVADTANAVAAEHPDKRLLVNVTLGHRKLALRQGLIAQSLFILLWVSIYIAERLVPTVEVKALNHWALGSVLTVAIRAGLYYKVFSPLPVEMAKSMVLRLLPLGITLVAAVQTNWSIWLFVGAAPTLPVLLLFAGFLGISVAVMGMWPTIPIGAVLFVMVTWPPFFFRLYQVGWVPGPVLLLLAAGVFGVLWACVFLEIDQVRSILDRSDEVELLVARLRDTNEKLTASNNELDGMRGQAARVLEARNAFFSGASHDFRQRLHAMKLLVHSAINRNGNDRKDAPMQSAASLNRLAETVEDVDRYLADVFDFARLDGYTLQPAVQAVPLQQLFQDLDLTLEDMALVRAVPLKIRTTGAVVRTDPSMLQRILQNLVSNAIKFSRGRVLVAARDRDGSLAIEVWDQGPGIPPETQAEIFRPFFQAAPHVTGNHGVGLGLAVVERFAQALEYPVSMRSRIGVGTVVSVLVPARDVIKTHYTKENRNDAKHR